VWHLKEDGDSSGYDYLDSTSNGNHGQGGGGTAGYVPIQMTGKIGQGQQFDDVDDLIEVPNSTSLNIQTDEVTVEGWIYSADTSPNGCIAVKTNDGGNAYYGLTFEDADIWVYTTGTSGADPWNWDTNQTIGSAGWHHVAYTYNGTIRRLYIDGAESITSNVSGNLSDGSAEPLRIGWNPWTGTTGGIVDEVRVSQYPRSASWIQTEYNNQKAPAAFYTVGIEETSGTGADPFNNGWTYRKKISIDASKVPSDLTNFPVLINTTDADLTTAQANFNDILFTAADRSTKLDHESTTPPPVNWWPGWRCAPSQAPPIPTSISITAMLMQWINATPREQACGSPTTPAFGICTKRQQIKERTLTPPGIIRTAHGTIRTVKGIPTPLDRWTGLMILMAMMTTWKFLTPMN